MIVFVILGNLLLLAGFIGLDYDISGVESNVVFTIQNILSDNSLLYANPEKIPFTVTQYSPLYYIVADNVISVFNIDPGNDFLIRIVGRSISIITCLTVAILFFRISKRYIGLNPKIALVLSLGVISFPVPWYYLTRPDVFVALAYLLFILTTLKYIDASGFKKAMLLGVLAFIAIASKQSGIFLVGMGGLFFLYQKDFKGLFASFLGFAIAFICFSLLYVWAGYEATYMLDNIVKGVDNGFGLRSFVDHTLLAFGSMYGAYFLGTMYLVVKIVKEERIDKKMTFLLTFAFLLFVFSTITAVKKGSTANYYHDFLIATLVIWAYYLKRLTSELSTKTINRAVLFVGLSVLLTVVFHIKTYTFVNFKKIIEEDHHLVQVNNLISSELGSSYIFSNVRQVSLKHPGQVMLPQFDIAECCAYPRGVYNYETLCSLMSSGKIKFLIFDNVAPQSLFGCDIAKHYQPYHKFGKYHVYVNLAFLGNVDSQTTITCVSNI